MRTYITLPFALKDTIKAAHPVKWDGEARRWFCDGALPALRAQEDINALAGRELQGISCEWRSEAADEERAQRAQQPQDSVLYTGRHIKLARVNAALPQRERIELVQRAVRPRPFIERAYAMRVVPVDEPTFSLTIGARDDEDAVGFARALMRGRLALGLVAGDIEAVELERQDGATAQLTPCGAT